MFGLGGIAEILLVGSICSKRIRSRLLLITWLKLEKWSWIHTGMKEISEHISTIALLRRSNIISCTGLS